MPVVKGYGVAKLMAPEHIVGEKLSELGFGPKGKWEVVVVLIKREEEIIVNPGQREVIKPDDVLILSGSDDKIEKLLAEAKKAKTEE
jgi:K+/H+ antiporter YhaU regulatory subunit KhtT